MHCSFRAKTRKKCNTITQYGRPCTVHADTYQTKQTSDARLSTNRLIFSRYLSVEGYELFTLLIAGCYTRRPVRTDHHLVDRAAGCCKLYVVFCHKLSLSSVAIRYVIPVFWMTSCFMLWAHWRRDSTSAVSLQWYTLANTPAAWYWLHLALDDGGRQD